jgi:hypothetical protein
MCWPTVSGRNCAGAPMLPSIRRPMPSIPCSARSNTRRLRGEYLGSRSGETTEKATVLHTGDNFKAEVLVPVWTSQLYLSDWWQPGNCRSRPRSSPERAAGNWPCGITAAKPFPWRDWSWGNRCTSWAKFPRAAPRMWRCQESPRGRLMVSSMIRSIITPTSPSNASALSASAPAGRLMICPRPAWWLVAGRNFHAGAMACNRGRAGIGYRARARRPSADVARLVA